MLGLLYLLIGFILPPAALRIRRTRARDTIRFFHLLLKGHEVLLKLIQKCSGIIHSCDGAERISVLSRKWNLRGAWAVSEN